MEQCDGATGAGGVEEGREGVKECTRGCGLLLQTAEDREHNCLAELRTSIEVLRLELLGKLEDQRREMQLLLDNQRGHMLQREALLQASIEHLKNELALISQQVQTLLALDQKRSQDLEKMESERVEMLEMLGRLQDEHTQQMQQEPPRCQHCARTLTAASSSTDGGGRKVTTL